MLKDFSKEEFDVIIQAGQSNSEGSGFGDATDPYIPNDNVWYLNNDFTISTACERVSMNQIQGNFSLPFAREYMNKGLLKANRKLLIIRAAVGGTGFCDKRWGLNDDLFLRMMEMTRTALELNVNNRLVALLWHQGETDSIPGAVKEVHYNNLSNLIKAVRTEFNYPDLPFVAGDFVNQWKMKNIDICEPIINGIKEVCANIGYARFVETSELLSNDQIFGNGDDIHFCREALYRLGVKYFNAYMEILKG